MVKQDLTEGSIVKSLFALALPIVFANVLQSAYQLIDTFWVGRLGQDAVAAVSLSFPFIFLMISLGGGLAIAGSIYVSQYKGKKDAEMINKVSAQTVLMMGLASLVLTVVGYFLAGPLLQFMNVDPNIQDLATSYLEISFLGIVFLFIFFMFQSLMRGLGEVRLPIYIVSLTVLLNLFLDPLFIFGYGIFPAMGVTGAAIATVVTQAIASLIGLFILFSGKFEISIKLHNLKPDLKLMKKMFFLGLPASIEQSTRALGMSMMAILVTAFGSVAIAAYGIGFRVLTFVIIPALGFSMATSALVGQNIGAGKIQRAEQVMKLSMLIAFLSLTFIGVLLFLFAHSLAAFFIPGELEVIESSTLFIQIMALSFGFIGIQQVLNGGFRGAGDTVVSMILAIVSIWILQFPIAFLLSHHTALDEVGIWIAFPLSNVIAAGITLLYFLSAKWKRKSITEEEKKTAEATQEIIVEEGLN